MKQRLGLMVLYWLRFWAKMQLKKISPDVIGITGSAGKTSCLMAVKAILQDKYRVKASLKANSESGIPLNILGLKPRDFSWFDWLRLILMAPIKVLTNWQVYDKYIVEMGIDSPTAPKNMAYLLSIVRPRMAIFLNVLPVHTAFFSLKDPLGQIAQEKGKLIASLPTNGLAILNADDAKVISFKNKTKAQVMTFGQKASDVIFSKWQVSNLGTSFTFQSKLESVKLSLPYLLPQHFGYSLGASLVVAIDEDMTLAEALHQLTKNFHLPPGRSSVFAGVNSSIVIDSSYNASPQTMADMLDLLAQIPGKRKLALLGDMRELGPESNTKHEKVIRQALEMCDQVHLTGPMMKANILAGAIWYENAHQAAEAIKPQLTAGDVILVKGSQNKIFLEAAVEQLLAKKDDSVKICRRGAYWEKQRLISFQNQAKI